MGGEGRVVTSGDVPQRIPSIISGVTWPTMKLFIQLLDAPRAMPYGRAERGQTSATTIQACSTLAVCLLQAGFEAKTYTRAPRPPEMHNKEPHHHDGGPTSCAMCVPLVFVHGVDDSDDEMAESHA